jgi:energy-coupling factor transporter ATP-binding protein EcfA2
MYIREVHIRNIRSLREYDIKFGPAEFAGWHVLLGDNGSGKSTMIRSIALALAGPSEAAALRQNWRDWLRKDEEKGSVELWIDHDPKYDKVTGRGRPVADWCIPAGLKLVRSSESDLVTLHELEDTEHDPKRYIWGEGSGWFSASYGPFRRFTGGSKDYEKLYYSNPRLAPHLTAFGEDVALTEAVSWLKLLHVRHLEKKPEGKLLEDLKQFINEGELLPHGTKLIDVSSDGVVFRDGLGADVQVEQLSDGYRSVLSMTFELIRQMVQNYGHDLVARQIRKEKMEIDLPGVVLIDEIDAHLHPTWQLRIGECMLRYFPKVQFIVTTHSPLICHAAEKGSVWRLPVPGDDSSFAGRVKGQELKRLIYGDIQEAYDTELFGVVGTRSESAKQKLVRLALLNQKSRTAGLTKKEKDELRELRGAMPLGNSVELSDNGD